MGPRQRQGHSRSKTHALPIILLSFLGFLLIAGVAFGIGMVGNVNRWLSDLPGLRPGQMLGPGKILRIHLIGLMMYS